MQLTSLDIRDTDISGPLPALDERFEKMRRLELSRSFLTGTIPVGLWALSKLTMLGLAIDGIDGAIPPEIRLWDLKELSLAGVDLSGSKIPSEIGLLSYLQVLDVSGANLIGSIPPELFASCTQLTTLRLESNAFTGSLPTEIGLATNLWFLSVKNASITGTIPPEVGSLPLLEVLDLSGTELSSSIPEQIFRDLYLLTYLNLGDSHVSGTIPSDVSGLWRLETLILGNTDIVGTVPSEIGSLSGLGKIDLSHSLLSGTIPAEFLNIVSLQVTDIRGTQITGFIPDDLCQFQCGLVNGALSAWERTMYVDCFVDIQCTCCTSECFMTLPPIVPSPSSFPSTVEPSMSIAPTQAPSNSALPSMSAAPTASRLCNPFSSIKDIGTASWSPTDEGFVEIQLPFTFNWKGQVEFTTVSVSPNGVIFLGDFNNCLTCDSGTYQDCCAASPIGSFPDVTLPRIAVSHVDLAFSSEGSNPADVYYAMVDDAFIISYEGLDVYPPTVDKLNLYFQVALYPSGDVEMRWGQGSLLDPSSIAAGLEDGDLAVPATGGPFGVDGVTTVGTWPENQCRTFVATKDSTYVEFTNPTTAPSVSLAPSVTPLPTIDSACMPFSPIAENGTSIFPFTECDESLIGVPLPFAFKWRGEDSGTEFTTVTVSPNGVVFLGDSADCPVWCQYDLVSCCEAFPIGELSPSGIARIALAQHNLKGQAYYASVGDAFIISFEGVGFANFQDELNLFFQVALYADGRVELRWGSGFFRLHQSVAAGLEDEDLAVPVTGWPFESAGVTAIGGNWPTGQCRLFVPAVGGDYTELF